MRDKIRTGKTRIFIMLSVFVIVLLFVGILMYGKMQKLLHNYVEKQVAKQAQVHAEVLEEKMNAELQGLESIAGYIQKGIGNVERFMGEIQAEEAGVNWGLLELGGAAIYGESLRIADYSGIQNSFRGNRAISYKEDNGLLFTVPVYNNGNVKYVLYKFFADELLADKFGMACYDGEGRILITNVSEQLVVPFTDWNEEDLQFFKREDVKELFVAIDEKMNIAQSASLFYDGDNNEKYIFVAEVGDYDLKIVGCVDDETVTEGLFYIVTLVLWVFGLLLLLLAIGMAFLFSAEEKVKESEELRKAKLMADMANKAKTDFLANMSHEIRTPINAVMGMNEMILRESKEESIKEYAVNVQSASKTLLSLINDILDLSKIEAGKMELVEEQYYLSSVLNNVVNMIQVKAVQKKLDFKVDIDETIPDGLIGDEVRVRQVLVNILNNAVKYTKEGSVLFKIEKKEESEGQIILKIAITDTGIGIRKEDMSKLFADFERFDYKENKHVEGTGLGLSITAKMVNLMKGSIEVESVYGEGSTFTVYIPQKIADYSQIGNFEEKFHNYVQSLKSYKESFRAPDAHILVVDDNEMNLFVVEKLLKKTDINVTCCDSGAKCLEFVKKEKFDLILLDHMMPGMDGIETMKQMKAMEDNMCKGMPVIALTANAILGVRDMYISEGFDDYLSKPVDVSALEAILKKYIAEEKIIVDEVKDTAVKEDAEVVTEAVESPEKETAAKTTETKEKNDTLIFLQVCYTALIVWRCTGNFLICSAVCFLIKKSV